MACIYQREEDSLWALSVAAHMSSPHQGLPQLRSDVGVTVLLRHHKEMRASHFAAPVPEPSAAPAHVLSQEKFTKEGAVQDTTGTFRPLSWLCKTPCELCSAFAVHHITQRPAWKDCSQDLSRVFTTSTTMGQHPGRKMFLRKPWRLSTKVVA
ncbi:uncharacterized protein LOC110363002 isoform X4 [Columba livia]|uniref:uncharacterized protein LOC110363002 isoform X4 n=1 Tax=Columba livia TaxID=8932 RepID=UPI0031BA57F3